jgi:DNA recombination protein RmuC
MEIAALIAIVFALVSAATCGVLYTRNQHLRQECKRLKTEFDQRQTELVEQAEHARDQARDTFKALASDALHANSEQFLKSAQQQFQLGQSEATKQLELRKQAVEALVKPLSESVKEYRTAITAVESGRKQDYGSLKKMVESMTTDQTQLRKETASLVSALRRSDVRGRWGEVQLRRVAELAGMIDRCDFDEQVTIKDGATIQRPDMLIHLPSDRTIVVDAKTPLDAYLSAATTDDDDKRRGFLDKHAEQVASKVDELSRKQYQAAFDRSPDFVVLFIPGEPFLAAAVQCRPGLIETAMERGVVIATPSTLISLLKVVALGWREEQIAENAEKISVAGRELLKRSAVVVGYIQDFAKSLGKTVEHYNRFIASYNSRLLVSARKLEELGVESSKKLPEQIDSIDTVPQEPTE